MLCGIKKGAKKVKWEDYVILRSDVNTLRRWFDNRMTNLEKLYNQKTKGTEAAVEDFGVRLGRVERAALQKGIDIEGFDSPRSIIGKAVDNAVNTGRKEKQRRKQRKRRRQK